MLRQEVIGGTRVKERNEIGPTTVADLLFLEETGPIDYAWFVDGKRRFGLDNLRGRHEHLLDNPSAHVSRPIMPGVIISSGVALHPIREVIEE